MVFLTLQDLIDDFEGTISMIRNNVEDEFIMLFDDDEETPQVLKPIEPIGNTENLQSTGNLQKLKLTAPTCVDRRRGERGFSMIELLIASTIITLVMLTVGTLNLLMTNSLLLVQNKQAAEKHASQLTSNLKVQQKNDLSAGGAFQTNAITGLPVRDANGGISLNCSQNYCDRIYVAPAAENGTQSPERIYKWNEKAPAGSILKFTRAWTISDEDASRNWRRISIAVFSGNSNFPLTQTVSGGVVK